MTQFKRIIRTAFVSFTFLLTASFALAASSFEITDIKMCKQVGEDRKPMGVTTAFPPGTQTVHAWFAWKNGEPGFKVVAKWNYASENIRILDYPFELTRVADNGIVSLRMPAGKSLPDGTYRLDFEADGKVVKSATFKVG
jgi:hypothetical protein